MHEQTRDDHRDLDRLIDAALGTYAEADSHLEQRVLSRLEVKRTRSLGLSKLVWAAALVVAACVLLFVILLRVKLEHQPELVAHNPSVVQQTPKAPVSIAPQAAQPGKLLVRRTRTEGVARRVRVKSLPKRDIFPSPQPLSPAEQVLVDFAARAPKAERQAFVAAPKQAADPITIAAIDIPPIQIPALEPPKPGTH